MKGYIAVHLVGEQGYPGPIALVAADKIVAAVQWYKSRGSNIIPGPDGKPQDDGVMLTVDGLPGPLLVTADIKSIIETIGVGSGAMSREQVETLWTSLSQSQSS